jgi:hypothetical protein
MKNVHALTRPRARAVLQLDRDTLRLLTGGRLRDDGGTDERTDTCCGCVTNHQASIALLLEHR